MAIFHELDLVKFSELFSVNFDELRQPADLIPPQLEKYRARLAEEGYPHASMEDLLSYISFPEVAKTFFDRNRWMDRTNQ